MSNFMPHFKKAVWGVTAASILAGAAVSAAAYQESSDHKRIGFIAEHGIQAIVSSESQFMMGVLDEAKFAGDAEFTRDIWMKADGIRGGYYDAGVNFQKDHQLSEGEVFVLAFAVHDSHLKMERFSSDIKVEIVSSGVDFGSAGLVADSIVAEMIINSSKQSKALNANIAASLLASIDDLQESVGFTQDDLSKDAAERLHEISSHVTDRHQTIMHDLSNVVNGAAFEKDFATDDVMLSLRMLHDQGNPLIVDPHEEITIAGVSDYDAVRSGINHSVWSVVAKDPKIQEVMTCLSITEPTFSNGEIMIAHTGDDMVIDPFETELRYGKDSAEKDCLDYAM